MQSRILFRRFHLRHLLTAACIVLTLAPTAETSVAGEQAVVRIENFQFNPEVVTVASGTSVTWINEQEDAHVVFTENGKFRSKTLKMGDRYTYVFESPGEYPYLCLLHPHMTGKIVVKSAAN